MICDKIDLSKCKKLTNKNLTKCSSAKYLVFEEYRLKFDSIIRERNKKKQITNNSNNFSITNDQFFLDNSPISPIKPKYKFTFRNNTSLPINYSLALNKTKTANHLVTSTKKIISSCDSQRPMMQTKLQLLKKKFLNTAFMEFNDQMNEKTADTTNNNANSIKKSNPVKVHRSPLQHRKKALNSLLYHKKQIGHIYSANDILSSQKNTSNSLPLTKRNVLKHSKSINGNKYISHITKQKNNIKNKKLEELETVEVIHFLFVEMIQKKKELIEHLDNNES